MNAQMNCDILRISEVTFVSLSCIGQPLWDLCECQVIVLPRTSMREQGLCDRGWCPFIYYIK